MTAYLLDANVFIQAHRLQYGFDFCPAFWDWLVEQNRTGRVASIERVADELKAVDDELAEWAKARGDGFFLKPDSDVLASVRIVRDWVGDQGYDAAAVSTFLQIADYLLVAHALALQWTVVTHEIPAETVRRVKIPNACVGLGLSWMNPFQMLRRERARFVLDRGGSVR